METQDVGSFSACVCQPDKHVSIYVIAAADDISKVGISRFPDMRLANLQSANPTTKLSLAFVSSGPKSKILEAERRAHAVLADAALGNEWFRSTQSAAIDAVRAILQDMGLIAS